MCSGCIVYGFETHFGVTASKRIKNDNAYKTCSGKQYRVATRPYITSKEGFHKGGDERSDSEGVVIRRLCPRLMPCINLL